MLNKLEISLDYEENDHIALYTSIQESKMHLTIIFKKSRE